MIVHWFNISSVFWTEQVVPGGNTIIGPNIPGKLQQSLGKVNVHWRSVIVHWFNISSVFWTEQVVPGGNTIIGPKIPEKLPNSGYNWSAIFHSC